MALQVDRKGFAQVEPNHLSGIVTGQIYAQLPVDTTTMGKIIENGRFAKYDYAAGKVNLTGKSEWMLIYNEQKLYDERKQSLKDFAMVADNYTPAAGQIVGEIVPRLIKTNIGDIYTTNAFGAATVNDSEAAVTGISLTVGDTLIVDTTTGYLKAGTGAVPEFQVVKEYTMPDGQPGVKIQRIK